MHVLLGRVGAARIADARQHPVIPILGVPLQRVMCGSAGSTRIRGAAWMQFTIELPLVGCFFVPMSNPEDGVDDALFAEPSIAKRLVPAMNGSRRERCQQYGGMKPVLAVAAGRGRGRPSWEGSPRRADWFQNGSGGSQTITNSKNSDYSFEVSEGC